MGKENKKAIRIDDLSASMLKYIMVRYNKDVDSAYNILLRTKTLKALERGKIKGVGYDEIQYMLELELSERREACGIARRISRRNKRKYKSK
jgi:hypothetical protein